MLLAARAATAVLKTPINRKNGPFTRPAREWNNLLPAAEVLFTIVARTCAVVTKPRCRLKSHGYFYANYLLHPHCQVYESE